MVRRILKNSTGNKSSRKFDYQALSQEQVNSVSPSADNFILVTNKDLKVEDGSIIVFGFYAKSDSYFESKVQIILNDREVFNKNFNFGNLWSRYYISVKIDEPIKNLYIKIPLKEKIYFWGLNIKPINLELMRENLDTKITSQELIEIVTNDALMPEIAYMNHDKSFQDGILIINFRNLIVKKENSESLYLKYCSLCDRLLPAKEKEGDRLAFHKHRPQSNGSFRSGFQQECRACKNRNINKKLNPKRTADQFFESSLLARERKMFL